MRLCEVLKLRDWILKCLFQFEIWKVDHHHCFWYVFLISNWFKHLMILACSLKKNSTGSCDKTSYLRHGVAHNHWQMNGLWCWKVDPHAFSISGDLKHYELCANVWQPQHGPDTESPPLKLIPQISLSVDFVDYSSINSRHISPSSPVFSQSPSASLHPCHPVGIQIQLL